MGVINMACGELVLRNSRSSDALRTLSRKCGERVYFFALPIAFLASGPVGLLMERFVVRQFYNRPWLESLFGDLYAFR